MMRQYQAYTGPITNTSAGISVEMFAGSHPDRYRQRLPLQLGQPISQPTTVAPMSIEMFAGNVPVRNRQVLGPRIPLPISQTTHVQNAFAIDMVAGNVPLRNRQRLATRFQQPFMNNESLSSAATQKFLPIMGVGR